MSHFIGLVFADASTNYEELLAPYNEQDEDYCEFQDRTDEVRERWEKLPELDASTYDDGTPNNSPCDKAHYPTIDDLAKHWFGYRKNDEGKWGATYNPNAKWDWYSEGGRWKGFIKTKDGEDCDACTFNEVDWDIMLKEENLPFCFVTAGGEWREKGNMGWWAMVSNEKGGNAWQKELTDYVQTLRNEGYADRVYVTAVDFHI